MELIEAASVEIRTGIDVFKGFRVVNRYVMSGCTFFFFFFLCMYLCVFC